MIFKNCDATDASFQPADFIEDDQKIPADLDALLEGQRNQYDNQMFHLVLKDIGTLFQQQIVMLTIWRLGLCAKQIWIA